MTLSLKHKKVKIKKSHTCYSCHRKFNVGNEMFYWASIYESDFYSGYTCITCADIMSYERDTSEGFPDGYVTEMLTNWQTPEQLLKELKNKAQ